MADITSISPKPYSPAGLNLILLLILLAPHSLLAQEPLFSTPFSFHDNRVFLEASVNGVNGHFILDTGGHHALNYDFAQRAGVTLEKTIEVYGAGEEQQRGYTTESFDFKIDGEFVEQARRPLAIDLSMIRDSLKLLYLDGIIGSELFKKYVVEINYADTVLNLYSFRQAPFPENAITVQFSYYKERMPVVLGEINGKTGRFLIDTGDRSELTLFRPYADKLRYGENEKPGRLKLTGYGVGGEIIGRELLLKQMKLIARPYDVTFKNVFARIPNHVTGSYAPRVEAGSIGNGLLKTFDKVIVNYQQKRIYLFLKE